MLIASPLGVARHFARPDRASPSTALPRCHRVFQQGVTLELPFDVGGQIQVRKLQQLDGLHQLRRHHERLALPHLKSCVSAIVHTASLWLVPNV